MIKNYFGKLLLIGVLVFAVSCSQKEEQKTTGKPESKEEVTQKTTEEAPGAVGSKAANFTLADLSGETVSLNDYEGKVVLVNFWATWCGPCKHEIPAFIEMYKKNKNQGFVIAGISGFREGKSKISTFAEKNGINYPVLFVEQENIQSLVDSYGGIRGIPTTFLVDRDGIIRHKWVGPRSEEVFMKEINKYL